MGDGMIIYGDDVAVVFECEHCGTVERIERALKKRTFQGKLNKFNRAHGWSCELEAKRQQAISTSDAVIKGLLESCR